MAIQPNQNDAPGRWVRFESALGGACGLSVALCLVVMPATGQYSRDHSVRQTIIQTISVPEGVDADVHRWMVDVGVRIDSTVLFKLMILFLMLLSMALAVSAMRTAFWRGRRTCSLLIPLVLLTIATLCAWSAWLSSSLHTVVLEYWLSVMNATPSNAAKAMEAAQDLRWVELIATFAQVVLALLIAPFVRRMSKCSAPASEAAA